MNESRAFRSVTQNKEDRGTKEGLSGLFVSFAALSVFLPAAVRQTQGHMVGYSRRRITLNNEKHVVETQENVITAYVS